MFSRCWLIPCLLLLLVQPVQGMPLLYSFDYTLESGEILSGEFEGELQADGDTLLVTDLLSIAFSGAPDLQLHTELFRNVVTLSGTGNSFTSLGPTPALAGFVIPFQFSGQDLAAISLFDDFTFRIDRYSPDRWRVTPLTGAVPLPGSFSLVLLCLCLAGLHRRQPN